MTKSNKIFKPMLADDVDLDKLKLPVIVLAKIDGVHQIVKENEDGVPTLFGRSLKPTKNAYLQHVLSDDALLGMHFEIIKGDSPTAEGICSNTTSMVNSHNKDMSEEVFTCYVFDSFIVSDRGYEDRLQFLTEIVSVLKCEGSYKYLEIPQHKLCNTIDEVLEFEKEVLEAGYEGIILRSPSMPYKNGRSTQREGGYLRLKRFIELNALCVGVEEMMENTNEAKVNEVGRSERSSHKANMVGKGMVGALQAILLEDLIDMANPSVTIPKGTEIKVGFSTTDKERKHYWENKDEIINKVIKFKSFPVNIKDKPRFPTYERIVGDGDIDVDVAADVEYYLGVQKGVLHTKQKSADSLQKGIKGLQEEVLHTKQKESLNTKELQQQKTPSTVRNITINI